MKLLKTTILCTCFLFRRKWTHRVSIFMIFFFPRVKTATFAISGWKAEKNSWRRKVFIRVRRLPECIFRVKGYWPTGKKERDKNIWIKVRLPKHDIFSLLGLLSSHLRLRCPRRWRGVFPRRRLDHQLCQNRRRLDVRNGSSHRPIWNATGQLCDVRSTLRKKLF